MPALSVESQSATAASSSSSPLTSSTDESLATLSTPSQSSSTSVSDTSRPKRWYGNFKTKITDLSKIPKAKILNLTVKDGPDASIKIRKNRGEMLQHVLVMAVLWKLFRKTYPNMEIEVDVGDRLYTPDVVARNDRGEIIFWGESGRMKPKKAADLARRYPKAHIVHCRHGMDIDDFSKDIYNAIRNEPREGRFTFASIPFDVWRFFDDDLNVNVTMDDLVWKEVEWNEQRGTDY